MLITRIELENIKSYRQFAVDLRRGTTAISGANGAGKTTIVEAIGYALFDYLPYKAAQFVREGAKYGQVVVHLIGSDDRPYTVERRCGTGASWLIYDREADSRSEQKADVLDKLHDIFGIDRERSLDTLFKDALGVPQGSFTAIFLQTASIRKQTFDTLLQIEDYKNAADYLLDAQKQYKEQSQTQQNEIQRLEFETRDLEAWRTALKEARFLDVEQSTQLAQWSQQLAIAEERAEILKKQQAELQFRHNQFVQSQNTHTSTQQRLQDRQRELEHAQTAFQAVEANRANYQRYLQASDTLKQLRQDEKIRNTLRQQQSGLQGNVTKLQTNITHLQGRLEEVALANKRLLALLPLVDQQHALELQHEDLTRKVAQYNGVVQEGKRLVQQREGYLQQQTTLQQRIAQIEPLQPIAALLQERLEAVAQLRSQLGERSIRQRQLQERREQLRVKHEERETYATRLRKAESTIAKIEEHRHLAEELPTLQQQYEQFSAQTIRLEGNIEGYTKSRQQSTGGLCPFLHEPCLNIKQHGISSLESYFDGLLKEDHTRLAALQQQQVGVTERITVVKKYADWLDKLGQYTEQRDTTSEHLQRIAIDLARLEREVNELLQDMEALKLVDQKIAQAEIERKESKAADDQVRTLEGLHMQVQQLQEQAQQCATLLAERRQQEAELRGSDRQLAQVKAELQQLNDPRGQKNAQHEIIKQEPLYQQQLQAKQQELQEVEQQLQTTDQHLATYAQLDAQIGEQEALLQHTLNGYKTYLANEQNALLLPQREQAYQEIVLAFEQVEHALRNAEQAYRAAEATFHPEELLVVTQQIKDLHGGIKSLAAAMRHTQMDITRLDQQIQQTEALLLELETARKEKETLEELHSMMEMFRKLIKEAAPHVLKAMLGDISAEANRIFGEIMGDRTAQLAWQNDYEITLRRQSVNRTFAQLSGGEQMSAALAVRLALLKKLSSLNIAFFDEPTQNMDELRRTNLAEQIRRVRGFDQLVVISHDDTFEQGLDSLIRLRKLNGETHQLTDDEHAYAQVLELSRVEQHAS